jgi:small-conductance mechanosensitive channel
LKKQPARGPIAISTTKPHNHSKSHLGGFLLAALFALEIGSFASAQSNSTKTPPAAAPQATQAASPAQAAPSGNTSGIDVAARSQLLTSHLNSVLVLLRQTSAPVQKVGEPSDLLYHEQVLAQIQQASALAFQAAKAEATLLNTISKSSPQNTGQNFSGGDSEQQRMAASQQRIAQRSQDLQTQDTAITAQIAKAKPSQLAALRQQKQHIEDAATLNDAIRDAITKIASVSAGQGETGLLGDIDRLESTAPELLDDKTKPVPLSIANLDAARSSGVSSQAVVLFDLLGARHSIDDLLAQEQIVHNQATNLRTPLTAALRNTFAQAQTLSMQITAPTSVTATPPANTPSFTELTKTFKAISGASVPLSQQLILLEQSQATLRAWRTVVDSEYKSVLRTLLLRVIIIGCALLLIFGVGQVWRRATTRYVRDVRRRRQILVLRRLVIGFLSCLVVLFGFVTQFNSLATFAGFITAGIAVGLQTILLSVAAYFFIIGRYGVRVGDRITVAGVSGDVIDVGLVRFYMQELAGTGTELLPTGRVAVFSNSVLFQAGTPLYKQMPGTEYAWHELTIKLAPTADYKAAISTMLSAISQHYDAYRSEIETQHEQVEAWMDTPIKAPTVESRTQFVDGGLQLWVRFPVMIREALDTDEKITEALLTLMSTNDTVKAAVVGQPTIKATVKG